MALLLVLMRDLRMRNYELMEARAELALSAVAAERERFARDLHDLLGHSLSVIAIKAELAGRLLKLDPERAAAEVADVEGVARESLREVRQAVSGYRQPTLDKELEGARVKCAKRVQQVGRRRRLQQLIAFDVRHLVKAALLDRGIIGHPAERVLVADQRMHAINRDELLS